MCIQGFCVETWGKRTLGRSRCRWEGLILKLIFRKLYGGKDWLDLAQNMDKWPSVVSAITNINQYAQISVIKLYFLIRCSTCFGLY